jgi:hypothetical protein
VDQFGDSSKPFKAEIYACSATRQTQTFVGKPVVCSMAIQKIGQFFELLWIVGEYCNFTALSMPYNLLDSLLINSGLTRYDRS